MRFVEAVFRKSRDKVEDGVRRAFGDVIDAFAASTKRMRSLAIFSAGPSYPWHAAANRRRPANIPQHIGRALHLLLVDHDALGPSADLLEQRMGVLDFLQAFLCAQCSRR